MLKTATNRIFTILSLVFLLLILKMAFPIYLLGQNSVDDKTRQQRIQKILNKIDVRNEKAAADKLTGLINKNIADLSNHQEIVTKMQREFRRKDIFLILLAFSIIGDIIAFIILGDKFAKHLIVIGSSIAGCCLIFWIIGIVCGPTYGNYYQQLQQGERISRNIIDYNKDLRTITGENSGLDDNRIQNIKNENRLYKNQYKSLEKKSIFFGLLFLLPAMLFLVSAFISVFKCPLLIVVTIPVSLLLFWIGSFYIIDTPSFKDAKYTSQSEIDDAISTDGHDSWSIERIENQNKYNKNKHN